ncbi:MAG: hypothetical protein ACR2OI_03605 [Acidimicrobiia bacterium]
MARRPLHLRWIYVKDHALLFSALVASLLLVLVAVGALADDPVRGLLLGALPALFGVLVWVLTSQAGYPSREPDTLPHERPEKPVEPPVEKSRPARKPAPAPEAADEVEVDEGPQWDPFAGERREVAETEETPEPLDNGDPFAHIDQVPAEPVELPARPE